MYWKPVFAALEGRFTCWLVNAAHLRNVPGRKTDVADSVWIARILECGLVRPSFVPVQEFRELRDLTRARTAVSQERVRVIQRLEKVLQDAGIKLTSVASQVWSKTARAVLEALLDGVTSPVELAALAKGRLRSKREALEEALEHRFRVEHHGVIVRGLLAHIDGLEQRLDAYDAEITIRLIPHQEILELIQTIPGVGAKVAQVLIAEIGLDILPARASHADQRPGERLQGSRCDPPRHRRGLLAHRPRVGPRMGSKAIQPRATRQAADRPARSPRFRRHHRTRRNRTRLNRARHERGLATGRTQRCPWDPRFTSQRPPSS
ncbi:IS110 family transposase [Streptomyces mirabilis]|uniref:IS110 family transposase n=1 Tax=Streptomyces mirabilis TaxID=68239 RepID=UPI00076584AB|nr:IS110 family transposase [Streptomyces mirabilis]MCX4428595.1 IS110 family transposase [Streptomyces mirabilis]